jgi:fumarylacetoacetate (FAA) hydrolase
MKLASIDNKNRDRQLVVVNKELTKAVSVLEIAATVQIALDDWAFNESKL